MGDRFRWVIYNNTHIIDMAYTQLCIKVTGRLAVDGDKCMINSHHHIIDMAYTQIDIKMNGMLVRERGQMDEMQSPPYFRYSIYTSRCKGEW
jgi:hypothetical protein